MNTSLPVAKKPLRQVANVRELLVNDMAREQLGKVAARHMNPERMMRIMANALRTTPQLAEADPMSLLGAMMNAAALGLEPNTPLGHAFLLPFRNNRKGITEVQLIVGYKGYADMARRSGQVKSLHADVVYSDDVPEAGGLWSYEYGSNMHLRHKPGPRAGQPIAAYAHVKLEDGEGFVVLPWAEVLKVRNASQGYKRAVSKAQDHPWISNLDAMARKTAVRALANRGELPMSIEFMEAVETDEQAIDYASFAKDPGAGPVIEGTASEDDDAPLVEDEEVQTPPQGTTTPPPAEETPHDPETGEVTAPKLTKKREKELRGLMATIIGNAADGGLDGAISFHADDIKALQAEAPALFSELAAELKAYETPQGEEGDTDDEQA